MCRWTGKSRSRYVEEGQATSVAERKLNQFAMAPAETPSMRFDFSNRDRVKGGTASSGSTFRERRESALAGWNLEPRDPAAFVEMW